MKVIAKKQKRLSLSEKFCRLGGRLRDSEWRRYGGALLSGKLLGVGLALALMAVVSAVFQVPDAS